jgi:hypothetical protein
MQALESGKQLFSVFHVKAGAVITNVENCFARPVTYTAKLNAGFFFMPALNFQALSIRFSKSNAQKSRVSFHYQAGGNHCFNRPGLVA